jgi:hypothetical protein
MPHYLRWDIKVNREYRLLHAHSRQIQLCADLPHIDLRLAILVDAEEGGWM